MRLLLPNTIRPMGGFISSVAVRESVDPEYDGALTTINIKNQYPQILEVKHEMICTMPSSLHSALIFFQPRTYYSSCIVLVLGTAFLDIHFCLDNPPILFLKSSFLHCCVRDAFNPVGQSTLDEHIQWYGHGLDTATVSKRYTGIRHTLQLIARNFSQ